MRKTPRDPFPSSPKRSGARRRVTLAGSFIALALGVVSSSMAAAGAHDTSPQALATTQSNSRDDVLDVIQVSGFLDEIVANFIERSIERAEERGSLGLVLQVNSTRSVISDERLIELARRIVAADVPVSMWVGPSGSSAKGGVGQLAGVVGDLALANGSKLGDLGPQTLPEDEFGVLFGDVYSRLQHDTIGWEDAIELGLSREAPTLGFFAIEIPGFETDIDNSGDEPVRVQVSSVRFGKLSLLDEWMHTAASPAVAYLLFIIGGALLVFELYTAGVGIAGVIGAVCLLFGCYGLDVLPTRWWAVTLLVIAMLGYAIDVQTGVPRAWSVIATACLVVGSIYLFEGISISWITLVAGIGGIVLSMTSGMPAMVRTRFGTPTIGREWMIGEMGVARESVDPEGVVVIQEAPWRARTNRATPIAEGDSVRVVAIEGLFLQVEPQEGGAKDYRDRH